VGACNDPEGAVFDKKVSDEKVKKIDKDEKVSDEKVKRRKFGSV